METKALTIRVTKELWYFLRKQSIEEDTSMTQIVIACVEKYKKKCEKELTNKDE